MEASAVLLLPSTNGWFFALPNCIRRSKDGEIDIAICKFIDRARQGGLKEPEIAYAIGPAEKCELLDVKIENDVNVEPFRLAHFAKARYVSAYLRNDRRAISIALACLGS